MMKYPEKSILRKEGLILVQSPRGTNSQFSMLGKAWLLEQGAGLNPIASAHGKPRKRTRNRTKL